MSDQARVTPLTPRTILGEAPHWVERQNCLLYVDLPQGNLHRYYYDTKQTEYIHIDGAGPEKRCSFIIPIDGIQNEYAVGLGSSLAKVRWPNSHLDGPENKPVILKRVDHDKPGNQFNDAKCDSFGRLLAGTVPPLAKSLDEMMRNKGTLFSFNHTLKQTSIVEKVNLSNGMAWSGDNRTFYYIDTTEAQIDAFDYDISTGNASNRREVINFKSSPGIEGSPDGMSVDVNGNLWVACFQGCQVVCVDPSIGKVLRRVRIPCYGVTSTCWGGPDYSTLFVTTGTLLSSQEVLTKYPDSGKTFAVTGLETKGRAPSEFKVDPVCLGK